MRARHRRRTQAMFVIGIACVALTLVLGIVIGAGDEAPPDDMSRVGADVSPPTPSVVADATTDIAALKRSAPTRIRIPSIGLTSPLMRLGIASDGSLEVPPGANPAGWFTGGPTPGEKGPAVIAGHISYNGVDGVFHDLHTLRVDDQVTVDREDGRRATFAVTEIRTFAKNRFPSKLVYGNIDHAGLRLITCDGFDPDTGTYDTNLVIFADLI